MLGIFFYRSFLRSEGKIIKINKRHESFEILCLEFIPNILTSKIKKMEKLQEIKKTLKADFLASELKFSIFVAALKNYKHDFLIRPFPPDFIQDGEKNFEKLVRTCRKFYLNFI